MSKHVDLWHYDAWTGEWTLAAKVAASFAESARDCIVHHEMSEPHEDGECLLWAPAEADVTPCAPENG